MHAGIPGVRAGGGGDVCSEEVVWDWRREVEVLMVWGRVFIQRSGECFYRSRRVTTPEPQDTLAAVSSEAQDSR